MAEDEYTPDHKATLGCGTLILIALIVIFFSNSGVKEIEEEVKDLKGEIGELRTVIDRQNEQLQALTDSLKKPEAE